ncbi:hypothetical protein AFLA_013838 [Aspergillus flavus NRRL3357]|nr:hypothetical protein AFLA_013838 [Aspergillus flavus NRRL3357]
MAIGSFPRQMIELVTHPYEDIDQMKGQNAICVCGSLAFSVKLRWGAGQRSWGAGNKSLFLAIPPDQIPKAHELSITHEEIHNGPPLEGSAR